MICPRCGTFFCDDDADQYLFTENRKVFCCQSCRNKMGGSYQRNKRRRHMAEINHASRKHHFPSEQAALAYLNTRPWRKAALNPGVYKCCVLGWQVTNNLIGLEKRQPVRYIEGESAMSNPVLTPAMAAVLMGGNSPETSVPSGPTSR